MSLENDCSKLNGDTKRRIVSYCGGLWVIIAMYASVAFWITPDPMTKVGMCVCSLGASILVYRARKDFKGIRVEDTDNRRGMITNNDDEN